MTENVSQPDPSNAAPEVWSQPADPQEVQAQEQILSGLLEPESATAVDDM